MQLQYRINGNCTPFQLNNPANYTTVYYDEKLAVIRVENEKLAVIRVENKHRDELNKLLIKARVCSALFYDVRAIIRL